MSKKPAQEISNKVKAHTQYLLKSGELKEEKIDILKTTLAIQDKKVHIKSLNCAGFDVKHLIS